MNLIESWSVVRAHWVTALSAALLGVILAASYLLLSTPQYTARTELFLAVENGTTTMELAQGSNYSQQQARNYSALATREVVLKPVITALTLETTPSALARQVATSVPLNTSIISVSVTDASAARATAIANAIGTSLSNEVVKLVPDRRDGTSPVRLEVVQPAAIPSAPSTPSGILVLAFGLLLGLLAGVALVLLRERLRAKVRTVEQVERLEGVNVLGSISYDRRASSGPIIADATESPRGESYRQLRTNLRFLQTDAVHKAFVVTSAVPGEGKTSCAANLASALAATGVAVCLVEADLRRPHLQHYLDLEGSVGLTSVITNEVALEDALQNWGPHELKVLLAGDLPPNPSELLGSSQAEALMRSLTERFDVTIIDCPPLLPVTDAALLAKALGGAILVVGSGRVEVRELKRALAALSAVGANLLGIVMNMVPVSTVGHYQSVHNRAVAKSWDLPDDRAA